MSTDYPAQILNHDASEIELEGRINFTDPANAPGGSQPLADSGWIPVANADVITLPSTAVEIIATPGPNKAIVVVQATLWFDRTADYSAIDAACRMFLANGNSQASTELNEDSPLSNVSGFLANGDPAVAFLSGPGVSAALDGITRGWSGGGVFVSDVADKPLNLVAIQGDPTNFGGGNAANVLNVKVLYYVADFS